MWYEILPTCIVITAFMSIPNMFVYFTNKLLLDQPYRRKLHTRIDAHQYLRDARLSGIDWAYVYNGLDNIPDVDQPAKPEEPASAC